jgi:hypothetical protein
MRHEAQNSVKLKQKKDKMMKTKTLIKVMAVGAALVAGASVAMANTILTVSSGTADTPSFGTGTAGTVTGAVNGLGQYEAQASFADGWSVSTTVGDATDAPLNIDLATGDHTKNNGKTISPITITFTTGYYPASGWWSELNTGNVSSDLGIRIEVDDSSGPLSVANYVGSSLTPITAVALWAPTGSPAFSGYTPLLGQFTETITITPLVLTTQQVSLDNYFTFTPVPDGGTPLMLLGSALTGLVGLRSKLGSKRG